MKRIALCFMLSFALMTCPVMAEETKEAALWFQKALDEGYEPGNEEEAEHLKAVISDWVSAAAEVAVTADSHVLAGDEFPVRFDLRDYGVVTKTASPRARVEYAMYRLNDDAQNPEDGEYLGKRLAYYDYAGFHREALVKGEIKLYVVAED